MLIDENILVSAQFEKLTAKLRLTIGYSEYKIIEMKLLKISLKTSNVVVVLQQSFIFLFSFLHNRLAKSNTHKFFWYSAFVTICWHKVGYRRHQNYTQKYTQIKLLHNKTFSAYQKSTDSSEDTRNLSIVPVWILQKRKGAPAGNFFKGTGTSKTKAASILLKRGIISGTYNSAFWYVFIIWLKYFKYLGILASTMEICIALSSNSFHLNLH